MLGNNLGDQHIKRVVGFMIETRVGQASLNEFGNDKPGSDTTRRCRSGYPGSKPVR